MGAVIEIFVAIAVLCGAGNAVLKEIHSEVRSAAMQKVRHGLPSLEAYSQKLTGKKYRWDKPTQKNRSKGF